MKSEASFDWTKPCDYDPEQKAAFHRAARRRLEALADAIGWDADSYDLRSNQGGIALSGEITLHHEAVYIQVSQGALGPRMDILIRTCRGRRDFTGGPNSFAPIGLLDDIPALCGRVRAVARI